LSEEDSEYEEAKEQVFNRRFRRPDPTLMILAETSEVPIEDPDVADLAESAIRRKFGFKVT